MSNYITLFSYILTALVTVGVCLVNNHYQNKRHQLDLEQKINDANNTAISDLRADFTAYMEEMTATYTTLSHSVDMLNVKLESMDEKVDKHNQVVERTYHLESDMAVIKSQLNKS